ncbi:MAG: choice-of-anchor D domain-containing protein, partial [Ignavibacteria bacterium]|nr:choice-of-anchor D domain-containing protein [Ignavibacteria bacterium]
DRYNPDLPVLVIDPIGDGGIADIKEIRGTVINNNLEIEYVFADGINISDSLIAVIYLDIDRNPLTGATDPFYYHDLGVDYFVDYFPIFFGNQIVIFEYATGNQYSVPYNINGTTISYSVPLSILGNDDGEMDLLAVAGHYSVADIDWAPDEGHITLADAFWLSENPTSGIIQPGGNAVIEITANTKQLIGGNYLAMINFSSNDPLNPSLEVPFTMHLTGVPQITLSDDTLDFGETYIGYYNSLSFTISSVGTDSLIGNIISSDPEFILVDSAFALPVGGIKNIEVQFHPVDTGFSTTTLMINSNAGMVPLNIYLTGIGVIAPNILTDTTSFYFAANTGDTLQSYFTIFNSGGSDLTVEISDQAINRSSERLFGAEFNTIYEIDPKDGSILNSFLLQL